jgi:hypothetical protein
MKRLKHNHKASTFATNNTSLSDASTSFTPAPMSIGRFIVLVPADSDYGVASRRIWELAVTTGRHVQLLSLCNTTVEEYSLRRQLILMSALVGDMRISTEAKVEIAANWVDAVKRNYQRGDIIVCFAEHRYGLWQKPLHEILEANLDAPVYILSGLQTQEDPSARLVSQAILWTGWIGIIAGFFVLQSRITLLPNNWAQTTLLILAVIFELWLIWVWNDRFS